MTELSHAHREILKRIRLVVFDFDGVFTDNSVFVTQDGMESVRCWRSDGLGLARLRSIGIQQIVLSTEANPVVSMRANKMGVECLQGVSDKALAITTICKRLAISAAETAFLGNDINDIPAFKEVGLPVAVADAYPEVLAHVMFRTARPGGHGAVRELCDLVYHARRSDLNGATENAA